LIADRLRHEIAADIDGDRLMRHLAEFARWTKHAGSVGELDSLRYIRSRLDESGYATELISHDAYISLPGAASIEIGGRRLPSITQSFSRPSPPEGLSARVIAVGTGKPADFSRAAAAGRIVLVDGIATPGAAILAGQAGAVGQIHVSPHEHAHEMCISPVWGSPTSATRDRLPTTVAVTTTKSVGAEIRLAVADDPEIIVTLHAEVDTGWRKTPILVAELHPPGAAPDAPFVMFSGHHDTWHFGVMDNGGANATMIEVARVMAARLPAWRRGLRLLFWSGHSQGRYSGSTWYADMHWRELNRRAVAHVNIDSTGARGNVVLADAQAAAELAPLAREAVRLHGGQELAGYRVARAGDQSFWGIGVPAIFSSLGEQSATGAPIAAAMLFGGPGRKGAGTGWWWHTPEDTLDKMDREIALRDTAIYADVVARLVTERMIPLDYVAWCDHLLAEIDRLAAALGGRIDLSDARGGAEALRGLVCALPTESGDDAVCGRVNACLMNLSRTLVPVDYTSGDRFDHDPALPAPAFPALQPLRELAATEADTDEAKFLTPLCVRGRNRIAHALDEAAATVRQCLASCPTAERPQPR
jgi:hypothetical protein